MKISRLPFLVVWLAAVASGAEPAKPAAPVAAPAMEATAEPEEVYIPEKPASKPVAPVPAVIGSKDKSSPADPKAKPGTAPTPKTVAITPPPLSPRFQQVRDRIDALLSHRSEAPPKFDPKKNPFRLASGASSSAAAAVPAVPIVSPLSTGGAGPSRPVPAPAAPVPEAAPAAPASGDLALLQQAIANLKVAGTVQIGVVAHLVINQVPYKEGDVIIAKAKGQPVYLRVKNISRYSYTLSLNDAELSVRY